MAAIAKPKVFCQLFLQDEKPAQPHLVVPILVSYLMR